jgi:hypothetical protein
MSAMYLYEDIISENEDGNGKRHKLLNPYYFGGLRKGKKNRVLWEEVQRYIEVHYDTEYLEKVYLCGDGATWIKAGCEYVDKSIFVLDRFHLQKYMNQSAAHLAEGHASHVYSSRMNSRPMRRADKMAQLRIYYYNKGNMLNLVRKQKEPVKEVEAEIIYSCQEILTSERNKHGNVGKYVEKISRTLGFSQVKKTASMKGHIWGL